MLLNASKSSLEDMFSDDDSDINSQNEVTPKKPFGVQSHAPPVAVPERIVFCIDTTHEMEDGYSIDYKGSQIPPGMIDINTIRNEALRVFLTNKQSIAKDTEFALVSLQPGKAELVSSPSSDIDQFLNHLTDLKNIPGIKSGNYDVTLLFNCIASLMIDVPEGLSPVIPPNYVLRVILMYGNSFIEPSVQVDSEVYKKFMATPSCILDIIYIHETQSDSNNVKDVFKSFGKIVKDNSYLLENGRNVTTLFNKMSKLYAHPYQRCSQDLWQF